MLWKHLYMHSIEVWKSVKRYKILCMGTMMWHIGFRREDDIWGRWLPGINKTTTVGVAESCT